MNFLSFEFAAFAALFVAVYWLIGHKAQKYYLLAGSAFVYGTLAAWFIPYILIFCAVIWGAGRCLASFRTSKTAIASASFAVLGINLVVFKNYAEFAQAAESVGIWMGIPDPSMPELFMPLGLSYYTFASVTYLVSVYRDQSKARSYADVACHLTFFPAIVMGPIFAAEKFYEQLDRKREPGELAKAFMLMLIAMAKILIIANYLDNYSENILRTPEMNSQLTILSALSSYFAGIYCNFSGFIDLVTGFALLLGFNLPQNFNEPFRAKNMQDFWRRWHMTLTEFITRYVYVPLGGSRCSEKRCLFNIVVAFLFSGLWHACSWCFVVWALLHGLAVAFNHVNAKHSLIKMSGFSASIFTLLYLLLTWIPFRATDLREAWEVLKGLFCNFSAPEIKDAVILVSLAAAYFAYPLFSKIWRGCLLVLDALPVPLKPVAAALAAWGIIECMPGSVPTLVYAGF